MFHWIRMVSFTTFFSVAAFHDSLGWTHNPNTKTHLRFHPPLQTTSYQEWKSFCQRHQLSEILLKLRPRLFIITARSRRNFSTFGDETMTELLSSYHNYRLVCNLCWSLREIFIISTTLAPCEAYSKLNLIKHSTLLWLNDWDLHEKRKNHLDGKCWWRLFCVLTSSTAATAPWLAIFQGIW